MKNGALLVTCWRDAPDMGAVTQLTALTLWQREGSEANIQNARKAWLIMIHVLVET